MSKILAIANTAGGSGKTTSARSIALAAAEYGKRTLLVDLDSRATLTFMQGVENPRLTALEVLRGSSPLEQASHLSAERYHFLPADSRLALLDQQLQESEKLVKNFRNALSSVDSPFDLVVIDSASAVSATNLLALQLSDFLVTPFLPNVTSARGVIQISRMRENAPTIKWLGSLAIQQELTSDYAQELADFAPILGTAIPKSTQIAQAELENRSVLATHMSAPISEAYRELTYFLLEDIFKG